jgi:hypothetical protein
MSSKVFLSNVKFQDATDSVSATDTNAAISVYGGASIAKSLYAGISINAPIVFENGIRVATVDALPTVGTGLLLLNGTISLDTAQPGVTSLGTLGTLAVTGNISSSAVPTDAAHLTNKLYVDGIAYITAGTGLTKSGSTFSVDAAQPGVTSLGTLSTLAVTGNVSSTAVPADGAHLVNKLYVDTLAYITAGTGLTKSGGTISINAAQPEITSVGTLTGLISSGVVSFTVTTDSTALATGALQVAGGTAISKSLFVGTRAYISGVGSGGTVQIAPVSAGAEASLSFYGTTTFVQGGAAGDQWTIGRNSWGQTGGLLVIGSAPGYGIVMTLNPTSGDVKVSSTTESTSGTTGALTVRGGISSEKAIFAGTGISAPNMNMHRNRVINGDMSIDQRGAGAAGVSGSNAYPVDRFYCTYTTAAVTVFQVNNYASLAADFTSLVRINTPISQPNTQYITFEQRIEGFHLIDLRWGTAFAKPVTLSFWAHYSLAGTYSVALRNATDPTMSYVTTYTVPTDSWTYVTMTIPGPTTGTWVTTTAAGLILGFAIHGSALGANATGTLETWQAGNYIAASTQTNGAGTATAHNFHLTGVQLERGSFATPFEFRPRMIEMRLCQRYWEKLDGLTFNFVKPIPASSNSLSSLMYSVQKASSLPTVTFSGGTFYDGAGSVGTTLTADYIYSRSTRVLTTTASVINAENVSCTINSEYIR